MVRMLKEAFGLGDDDFRRPRLTGMEPAAAPPSRLAPAARAELEAMLGPENVRTDDPSRLAAACGKGMLDLLRLRRGIVEHLPDAVLHPRDRHDLVRIVDYCSRAGIPMTPRGAATSGPCRAGLATNASAARPLGRSAGAAGRRRDRRTSTGADASATRLSTCAWAHARRAADRWNDAAAGSTLANRARSAALADRACSASLTARATGTNWRHCRTSAARLSALTNEVAMAWIDRPACEGRRRRGGLA